MSLKVIVPNGRTEITVNGLHQWDYGRTIEIQADSLSDLADVEVHFACTGMETAVVRNCAVLDGKATAAVPDICLEQTTPIVAWVYAIGETTGATILTITLPIIPRTQPQLSPTVPETVSDKYTEAIAAMEYLVDTCRIMVNTMSENLTDIVLENVYKEGVKVTGADRADAADKADAADVLTPTALMTSAEGVDEYPIDSTGLYLVIFQAFPTYPGALYIAVPDLQNPAYGSEMECKGPDPDGTMKRTFAFFNRVGGPNISVCHGTSAFNLPILAVYKIAEL